MGVHKMTNGIKFENIEDAAKYVACLVREGIVYEGQVGVYGHITITTTGGY